MECLFVCLFRAERRYGLPIFLESQSFLPGSFPPCFRGGSKVSRWMDGWWMDGWMGGLQTHDSIN